METRKTVTALMKGVYVGLRVMGGANAWLDDFIAKNGIPVVGAEQEPRRHVTVIYSRGWQLVQPRKDKLYQAYGKELSVFNTQEGKRCLVLVLDAPEVVKRHEELRNIYPSLTHDFPNYIPHITLSYDIGDLDVSKLVLPSFAVVLGEEYVEDLDLNWENK